MSLTVVGSVALDTVETPMGTNVEGLGGSAVYFSLAAQHFSPVHLVGVVGEDFPDAHMCSCWARNASTWKALSGSPDGPSAGAGATTPT
jgi:hypothetical protein